MNITSQFSHCKPKVSQAFLEITNNFSDKSLHWSNINNLERLDIELSISLTFLGKYLKDSEKCNIGLSSSSRCANEKILIAPKRRLIDLALNVIERLNGCGECSS